MNKRPGSHLGGHPSKRPRIESNEEVCLFCKKVVTDKILHIWNCSEEKMVFSIRKAYNNVAQKYGPDIMERADQFSLKIQNIATAEDQKKVLDEYLTKQREKAKFRARRHREATSENLVIPVMCTLPSCSRDERVFIRGIEQFDKPVRVAIKNEEHPLASRYEVEAIKLRAIFLDGFILPPRTIVRPERDSIPEQQRKIIPSQIKPTTSNKVEVPKEVTTTETPSTSSSSSLPKSGQDVIETVIRNQLSKPTTSQIPIQSALPSTTPPAIVTNEQSNGMISETIPLTVNNQANTPITISYPSYCIAPTTTVINGSSVPVVPSTNNVPVLLAQQRFRLISPQNIPNNNSIQKPSNFPRTYLGNRPIQPKPSNAVAPRQYAPAQGIRLNQPRQILVNRSLNPQQMSTLGFVVQQPQLTYNQRFSAAPPIQFYNSTPQNDVNSSVSSGVQQQNNINSSNVAQHQNNFNSSASNIVQHQNNVNPLSVAQHQNNINSSASSAGQHQTNVNSLGNLSNSRQYQNNVNVQQNQPNSVIRHTSYNNVQRNMPSSWTYTAGSGAPVMSNSSANQGINVSRQTNGSQMYSNSNIPSSTQNQSNQTAFRVRSITEINNPDNLIVQNGYNNHGRMQSNMNNHNNTMLQNLLTTNQNPVNVQMQQQQQQHQLQQRSLQQLRYDQNTPPSPPNTPLMSDDVEVSIKRFGDQIQIFTCPKIGNRENLTDILEHTGDTRTIVESWILDENFIDGITKVVEKEKQSGRSISQLRNQVFRFFNGQIPPAYDFLS